LPESPCCQCNEFPGNWGCKFQVMERKKTKRYVLRVRAADKNIFDAIKNGKKKVDTRAATERYRDIKAGDTIVLACGTKRLEKRVQSAKIFRTVRSLLREYKPKDIHPEIKTESDLIDLYRRFPGYREKIKKFGLIALELK